jgi:hypothetical protein
LTLADHWHPKCPAGGVAAHPSSAHVSADVPAHPFSAAADPHCAIQARMRTNSKNTFPQVERFIRSSI